MIEKPLVIYHHPCMDGSCAAWIVKKHFETLNIEVELLPITYGNPVPDITDRKVFIVDFSFPRDIIIDMITKAHHVVLLDHHQSAQKDLDDIQNSFKSYIVWPNILFDMTKSGAMLTWNYFHPGKDAPLLVKYIEDRDIWAWKLPGSREVNAAISSYDYEIDTYDRLSKMTYDELYDQGVAILRFQNREIECLIKEKAAMCWFGSYYVPICNNSAMSLTSELGNRLAKNHPFSIVWTQRNDGQYYYSLRSIIGDGLPGLDVSVIAKSFNGGGHKQSSGITSDKFIPVIVKGTK